MKLNTIELFSGTKSFSKVANKFNYKTFTIDNAKDLNPDLCVDFNKLDFNKFINNNYDILWASPPCTTFSVASIGRHWNKDNTPKTDSCKLGLKLLENTIKFISVVKPKIWYIENPRGKMRKIIDPIFKKYNINNYRRVTVTYCQYGDKRMKPTDIWTNNMKWVSRPMCKNGDSCHISAPRGSKTGTQGLKNAKERGKIPSELFIELFTQNKNQKRLF